MKTILAVTAAACLASPATIAQGLIGSSVSGDLTFGTNTVNMFDPANGSYYYPVVTTIPAGDANTSSPYNVPITAPSITFGALADYGPEDPDGELDMATLTGNQLTVGVDDYTGNASALKMTFTDPAFAGMTLTLVGAEDFNNGGLNASLVGDTITIAWAGEPELGPDPVYSDTFDLTALTVPDGASSFGLLSLALAGLGSLKGSKSMPTGIVLRRGLSWASLFRFL
ncbi:MAG: hypothetical protein ABSF38_01195 [Verrucomicrobiota bacterium]|jgi:hypothetical protein